MTGKDEKISSSVGVEGDGNSIVNNVIDDNRTINTTITINLPDGASINLTVNARLVLRDLYESVLKINGQINMVGFNCSTFGQQVVEEYKISLEELQDVQNELFMEDCIIRMNAGSFKLTQYGKEIGRYYYKNFPKEYDQERERVLKFFIVQAACNLHSRSNFAGLLSIESKFTEVVVQELERDGLITKYMNNGEMVDRYLKGEFQRKATPVFYERYAKEIATHKATIRS